MSGDRDNFDALDEMLATARWPEMSAEATGRLRANYLAVAGGRREMVLWWASVAAVLMLGVAVWMGAMRASGQRKVDVVTVVPAVPLVAVKKVEVRPANAAEMVVALTAARRQRPVGMDVAVEVPVADVDVAAQLRLVAGKSRAGEALEVLKAAPGRGRVVEELFTRLDDPRVEVRLAAARALGYLDGPSVTERLAGMVEGNRNRREALAALMQSEGREAQEFLRRARREEDVEAAMRSVAVQVKSF